MSSPKTLIAIVGCVENGREDEYRNLVDQFMHWCGENCLQLNVKKTKEIVVCGEGPSPHPVLFALMEQMTDVEIVQTYRYPGVHLNNKI